MSRPACVDAAQRPTVVPLDPALSALLKDEDPTGPLVQTHHEIHRLTRLFARLVAQLPAAGPGPEDLRDLRRVLFGLHAILSLHFARV